MISAIRNTWALMLGMFMLMIGNGLQGNVLSLRAGEEGFDQGIMGFVMSAYFVGFLIGPRITTILIRRVGHVRVFAAFASLISAAFIVFPLLPSVWVWMLSRFLIGVSFAAVFIVSESWLNNASENEERAKVLSIYSLVQMSGVIAAGFLVAIAPVNGYVMFVIMSILVSLSFAPILLSTEQAPSFESAGKLTLREMYESSPLGVMTILAVGGMMALQFSMIGEYVTAKGLSQSMLSVLFIAVYLGGIIFQMPIGLLADRFDRRYVIILMSIVAATGIALGNFVHEYNQNWLIFAAFMMGGIVNPLYSVGVAYINDRVEWEKMPAAAAGIALLVGLGAVGTPVLAGFLMQTISADIFWYLFVLIFLALAAFGAYRALVSEAAQSQESAIILTAASAASPVLMEMNQEIVADQIDAQLEQADDDFSRFVPEEILEYWLEEVGPENWYNQSEEIDSDIRERYSALHRRMVDNQYENWLESPNGTLATLIVLDQFSRNLYREDGRAFENDERARNIARLAIEKGYDRGFERDLRQFFYLPLCHSEILSDLDEAIEGAKKAGLKSNLTDFKTHREIISQYGRYPFRNQMLGRDTTEAEQEFLDEGGYKKLRKQILQKRGQS